MKKKRKKGESVKTGARGANVPKQKAAAERKAAESNARDKKAAGIKPPPPVKPSPAPEPKPAEPAPNPMAAPETLHDGKTSKPNTPGAPVALHGSLILETFMGAAVALVCRLMLGALYDEAAALMEATKAERAELDGKTAPKTARDMDKKRAALTTRYTRTQDNAIKRGAYLAVILATWDIRLDFTGTNTAAWTWARDINGKIVKDEKTGKPKRMTVKLQDVFMSVLTQNYGSAMKELQCLRTAAEFLPVCPEAIRAALVPESDGARPESESAASMGLVLDFLAKHVHTDSVPYVRKHAKEKGIGVTWQALTNESERAALGRPDKGKGKGKDKTKGKPPAKKKQKHVNVYNARGEKVTLDMERAKNAAAAAEGKAEESETERAARIVDGVDMSETEREAVKKAREAGLNDGWAALRSLASQLMGDPSTEGFDMTGAMIFVEWLSGQIAAAGDAAAERAELRHATSKANKAAVVGAARVNA